MHPLHHIHIKRKEEIFLSFLLCSSISSAMAVRQGSLFFLVVLLLLLWESNADAGAALKSEAGSPDMYGSRQGSLHPQECTPRCNMRCSATAYKKACLFFCEKCCATCLCVPPGTYGNKQVCPCYNNWKTQRGGPKCP